MPTFSRGSCPMAELTTAQPFMQSHAPRLVSPHLKLQGSCLEKSGEDHPSCAYIAEPSNVYQLQARACVRLKLWLFFTMKSTNCPFNTNLGPVRKPHRRHSQYSSSACRKGRMSEDAIAHASAAARPSGREPLQRASTPMTEAGQLNRQQCGEHSCQGRNSRRTRPSSLRSNFRSRSSPQ